MPARVVVDDELGVAFSCVRFAAYGAKGFDLLKVVAMVDLPYFFSVGVTEQGFTSSPA